MPTLTEQEDIQVSWVMEVLIYGGACAVRHYIVLHG